MKKFFNVIVQDKVLLWGFSISFFLILIGVGITSIMYNSLPPFLPLYNSLSWGYGRVGERAEIFIPIGITFFFFFTNILFSKLTYARAVLVSRSICASTAIISFISVFFIINIILLIH